MTYLSEFLPVRRIVMPMASEERAAAITELLTPLLTEGIIGSVQTCQESILKRERRMSTGIGKGVALPHGISDEVNEVVAVMGLSRAGIEFKAVDNLPCHIFVLLICPGADPDKHHKLLSRFSRVLNDGKLRSDLLEAINAEAVVQILNDWDNNLASDDD